MLVSRETALFRQAILRVLTKKHGCIVAMPWFGQVH